MDTSTIDAAKGSPLDIPTGASSTVHIIDSTSDITFPSAFVVTPSIRGHEQVTLPSYSFAVTSSTGRHVLFDLGVRKRWSECPPRVRQAIEGSGAKITVQHDVADLLDSAPPNIPRPHDIEAVIWSHHHWDHTGDMQTFPATTALVVGPGFKAALLPAYPTNPDSELNEADWRGREFREVCFGGDKASSIGGFRALDYFGDGSFYLLDAPGHTVGHLCGLARLGSGSAETFIFMGADACHHPGEFRPSPQLALPSTCVLHSSAKWATTPCPGTLLQRVHRTASTTQPFYEPQVGANSDHQAALETIQHITSFDADPRVLVIIAHDAGLRNHLEYLPVSLNASSITKLDERTRWLFLDDFALAVDELQ